jgi:hypothetical protein
MTPRPEPVTSDWQVAHAMIGEPPEQGLHWLSGEIAETIGITVFQITARLKAMEKREIVRRGDTPGTAQFWLLTENGYYLGLGKEPPKKEKAPLGERVYRTPTGGWYSPGGGTHGLPDDSAVPRRAPEDGHGWRLRYVWEPVKPNGEPSDGMVEVFIDREGNQWVRAEPNEEAHLVCENSRLTQGLRPCRLRRMDGTSRAEQTIAIWDRHRRDHIAYMTRNER